MTTSTERTTLHLHRTDEPFVCTAGRFCHQPVAYVINAEGSTWGGRACCETHRPADAVLLGGPAPGIAP